MIKLIFTFKIRRDAADKNLGSIGIWNVAILATLIPHSGTLASIRLLMYLFRRRMSHGAAEAAPALLTISTG